MLFSCYISVMSYVVMILTGVDTETAVEPVSGLTCKLLILVDDLSGLRAGGVAGS